MTSLTFKIALHGTPDYEAAVTLKETLLRKPLDLIFLPEELAKEKKHTHVIGLMKKEVVATAALVPEKDILKMQRVAIREDLQGQGIGSSMIHFCENYARTHGFKEMYCHARETAVPFYLKNHYFSEGDYFDEDTLPHLKVRKVL